MFDDSADANAQTCPDVDVASHASRARMLVVTAREDLTVLADVKRVLAPS